VAEIEGERREGKDKGVRERCWGVRRGG